MAIKVNLADVLKMRQNQEIDKPYGSTDSEFPLFKTPVGENLLVYIPTLNVTENPDGTTSNELLYTALHNFHSGKRFGTITCISGIDGESPIAQALGYTDHTCPACDAVSECWNLVNAKIEALAKELGIDPNEDKEGRLEPSRKKFISEMAMQRSNMYVTFPIVVIPHKNLRLTEGSIKNMQGYFVTMTKQRYEEKVCAGLTSLLDNPGHIGGRFMLWKFIYDTKGQQPNARDAAKNASFNIINDVAALTAFEPCRVKGEEIGAKFTNLKALEVLTALEPVEYTKILSDVNSVMKETRQVLATLDSSDGAVALPSSPEKALEAFGATSAGSVSTAITGATDGNLGVSTDKPDAVVKAHRFDG